MGRKAGRALLRGGFCRLNPGLGIRYPDILYGAADRGGGLAGEVVLPGYDRAVREAYRQMAVFAGDGPHGAAHLHQFGEQVDHRVQMPPVAQVACREHEIAEACAAQVEVGGHVIGKDVEVVADDLAHGVCDAPDESVPACCQRGQLRAQGIRRREGVQPVGEEIENLRIALNGLVRQCHEAVAHVAYGRHVEGVAQHGGAAARIEGRDQVDGVVGVAGEMARNAPKRRAAAEEEDARAKVRSMAEPFQLERVRQGGLAGDHEASRAVHRRRVVRACAAGLQGARAHEGEADVCRSIEVHAARDFQNRGAGKGVRVGGF